MGFHGLLETALFPSALLEICRLSGCLGKGDGGAIGACVLGT